MKRALRYTAALLGALLGALVLYALATQPPKIDTGPFLARGQDYTVRIIRDDFGVPHIYGRTDADTAFGLAYAHAEDDFPTIQDVLLATRGKLAAVKGADAAQTDYLVQMMRVWPAVDEGYATRLAPHTRAIAEAYADGINLYAAQHPGEVLPYVLPVTGKDVIAGFTFKAPLFYGFDSVLGELFNGAARQLARQGDAALQFTAAPQPEIGSQGVAVAPRRTSDGATRLLVNSHQPLTGPVAWYEARLVSQEGWDIAGGTFPGSPLILHGHNRHLGWSNTVNKPDLVDVYQLELNPENPDQYRLDGEWVDLEVASADILVRLLGPLRWTFSEPLYFSRHGPVLKLDHGAYALRWAGMGEIRMLEQMLAINKARNMAEFEAALAQGAQPSINYVYADAQGNIAHYYNAMFPRRQEGWDWSADLPGDRSDLIWQDYLPFSAVPMTVNPPSGFVFNANNTPFVSSVGAGQPLPEDFSATLGIETHLTNRAHRLRRLLQAEKVISAEDFRRIKYDLRYDEDLPGMQRYREFIAAGLDPADADLAAAFELLGRWDGATDRDNNAAALALLTLAPLLDFRQEDGDVDLTASLRDAAAHLRKHFGRIDPPFGELNRLRRGNREWPLDGGPDILRAVYGEPDDDTGELVDVAGDSYIMFVQWDGQGRVTSTSMHSFGSATLDASSPHYDDQAPLFATMQEKPVYLELDELLRHASRDYTPQHP